MKCNGKISIFNHSEKEIFAGIYLSTFNIMYNYNIAELGTIISFLFSIRIDGAAN